MQAQVEPHFLFNTLASVQELAQDKAPEAAALTHELIAFLRPGLASLRDDTTTLEREFDRAAAYLAIMKTRMGERLTYDVNLPSSIGSHAMPPAMLISSVENAKPAQHLKWVRASAGNITRLIHADDILFFQPDLKYERIVSKDGEAFVRTPMRELIDALDLGVF